MNIVIIGEGTSGINLFESLTKIGHRVCYVDHAAIIDDSQLSNIDFDIYESIHEKEAVIKSIIDYKQKIKQADVIMIAVEQLVLFEHIDHLEYINEIAQFIAEQLEKNCVIAITSTVPVGQTEKIEQWMTRFLKKDIEIEVVYNHEIFIRLRDYDDSYSSSYVVIGVESGWAEQKMYDVYENFHHPLAMMDRKSAEMVQFASDGILALQMSFINELAVICEKVDANVDDVSRAIKLDPRIKKAGFRAGVDFRHGYFMKELKTLYGLSENLHKEMKTVKAALEVNQSQRFTLLEKAKKYYASFNGLTVAVLGLTYSTDSDEVKEAAAYYNVERLLQEGANIKVWDPIGMDKLKQFYPTEVYYSSSIEDALVEADLCFIFTDWNEIKRFDIYDFSVYMKQPIVLDGSNCYNLCDVKEASFLYESIGRKIIDGRI